MVIPKINSAHGSETRNIINRAIDIINTQGKSIQDLVAKGQLTPKQYAELIAIVNDTATTADLETLNIRFNEVIRSSVDGVNAQEIIDARQGENSLGDNIRGISDRTNIKINNHFNDGDFKNGTDNWVGGNNVTVSRSNGRLKALKTGAAGWLLAEREIKLKADNLYHLSVGYLKQSAQEGQTGPTFNIYYDDDTFTTLTSMSPTTNIQSHSIYFTPTKPVKKIRLTSYNNAINTTFDLDKISIINVSEAFGGNTPSLQELENFIDEYFNGFIDANASLSHSITSLIQKQIEVQNIMESKIFNLLPDSNFENGDGGWAGNVNSGLSVVNNHLRVKNITGAANIQTRKTIDVNVNETYFINVKAFSQSKTGSIGPRLIVFYTDNTFDTLIQFDNNTKKQNGHTTFKPQKNVREIGLMAYVNTVGAYFEVDEVSLVNLSENFGEDIPSASAFKNMIDNYYTYENGMYVTRLNDAVNSLMSNQGGNSSNSFQITRDLTLEAHGLDLNTGRILPSTNTNYAGLKRTGKYLSVVPGSIIKINESASQIYVFEYDGNFNFIKQSTVSDNLKLSNSTKMIKVMTENYNSDKLNITFHSPFSTAKWVKNERTTSGNHNFIFEVNPTEGRDITHTDTHKFNDNQYTTDRYYTSGLLKLPPNYTPDGEPVKLIIFCHGSADYNSITSQSFGLNFENYFQYLSDEGYAIMDVFSWTTKYPNAVGANFGSPIAKAGLMQGYEWVKNNYNIDNSGVFVSAKSAGGYQAVNLLYNNAMPIKAAGLLAPALLPIHQPFGYNGSTKVAYADDFGFEGDTENILNVEGSVLPMTQELREYLTLNVPKIIGYVPIWNGIVNGNFDTMLENTLNKNEKMAEYQSLSRVNNVPTKIWAAIDDGDDDWGIYGASRIYIHTLKNANNIAEIRTMPANTGSHNAVDSSPDALKVSSITTRLGYTHNNVPLAYVELVSFFRRFES